MITPVDDVSAWGRPVQAACRGARAASPSGASSGACLPGDPGGPCRPPHARTSCAAPHGAGSVRMCTPMPPCPSTTSCTPGRCISSRRPARRSPVSPRSPCGVATASPRWTTPWRSSSRRLTRWQPGPGVTVRTAPLSGDVVHRSRWAASDGAGAYGSRPDPPRATGRRRRPARPSRVRGDRPAGSTVRDAVSALPRCRGSRLAREVAGAGRWAGRIAAGDAAPTADAARGAALTRGPVPGLRRRRIHRAG